MRYILFLLALALLVGCAISKKDQRALDRVQAKRSLVDKMLPVIQDLYPCVADTVAVIIPGGVDSVYYPVPIIDTVYDRQSGYAQGFIDGQLSITKKKYAVMLPDTVLKTVIDRTGITTYQKQIAYLNGQITEKNDRLKELQNARKQRDWWLYGLIAMLVITNAIWAVIRLK